MTRADIAALLKAAAMAGGLEARFYSSHSLRRGGAQRLRDLGFSEPFIQLFGGWKSRVVRRYASPPASDCQSVAAQMFTVS